MTKFEVLATTSDIGAGAGFKKWRPEYYEFFQDRDVIIIPDNDKVSKIFYREIGNNLVGTAKSIKFLELPDLKEHGDTTDWLMQGGTLADLFELIKIAPKFPLAIPIEERTEVNLKEIIEADLEPEEMIIDNGIMGTKNYTLIVSRHKKGKTLFSLNLALNLISGTPFLETYKIKKKCKVLYIFSESSIFNLNEVIPKQIKGLEKLGIMIFKEELENLLTYNTRKELLTINLSEKDDLSRLQKCLDTFEPDVVIIDPIGRIATFDMNKDSNITLFSNLMIQMRDCHWVIIHHTRKEISKPKTKNPLPIDKEALFDSIRGSSNWCNNADTIICLTHSKEDLPDNYLKVFFESKRGFEPMPLEVKWDIKNLNYELIDITDLHKKIRITYSEMLEYIKKHFKGQKVKPTNLINALSQNFRVTPPRVYQLLGEAKANGDMIKDPGKFGKWYISDQEKLF
jgi:archaellum biogenesis ATPase FlaH